MRNAAEKRAAASLRDSHWRVQRAFLTLLAACVLAGPTTLKAADSTAPRPVGRWHDVSLDDYRKHLVALGALTEACAKARDLKACDPTLVGPDDRIPLGSASAERRIVRYGWLRILFSRAEEPDKAQEAPDSRQPSVPGRERVRVEAPATSQLLVSAQARLARDLVEVNGPPIPPASDSAQRDVMKQVLAGREFSNLKQPSDRDSTLERLSSWLNRLFANIDKLRTRSVWVGRALIWGFFLAVAVGLAWGLFRIERRWRGRLVPFSDRPAPQAASARDWQLWLADARKAAAANLWREAIHSLYWASISRLESRRLWPADRARTPREYLALVAPNDPHQAGLASLTRGFERTWYGGREAAESDYRQAEALAVQLISEGGAA